MLISHVRWTMRIIRVLSKSFKVLACTPDSSALVVDMKDYFGGSAFTKPFLRHRLTDTMDSCRAIILCNRINLLFWVYRLQKII